MIVLCSAILGALAGILLAKKQGGGKLDMAQYAVSMGIAFALAGLVITIVVHRLLV